MNSTYILLAIVILSAAKPPSSKAGGPITEPKMTTTAASEPTAIDIFHAESYYTLSSAFHDKRLGRGDSSDTDITYDHRFHIKDNWYFRTGVEYERFSFGGDANGLPSQLQSASATLALEYMVENHAGVGIEIHPGYYFQNRISSDAFDVPWRIFTTVPIKDRKCYIVIGAAGSLYYNPAVLPVGGVIWILNDKVHVEGVFPKPAIVYNPNQQWEFRLGGEVDGGAYRTDSLATVGGNIRLNNAVVQYLEYRAGVKATWSGIKHVDLCVGAGYSFGREFDFYRAHFHENTDGGFYFQLGGNISF